MSFKIRRVLAYIFDVIAISLISSALSMSPLNPNIEKKESLNIEYTEKVEELNESLSKLDSDEDSEKVNELSENFYEYYQNYLYKQTRISLYEGLITFSSIVLYFVFFAYFFEGETVGKRLMKIKIVKNDGKRVKIVNLLVRAAFLYGVIITALNIIFSYVFPIKSFLYLYNVLYYISLGIEVTTLIMILKRNDGRGLHDLIAGTKVIDVKEN